MIACDWQADKLGAQLAPAKGVEFASAGSNTFSVNIGSDSKDFRKKCKNE